jgi:O-antigen/teichoic acid export membrane protein
VQIGLYLRHWANQFLHLEAPHRTQATTRVVRAMFVGGAALGVLAVTFGIPWEIAYLFSGLFEKQFRFKFVLGLELLLVLLCVSYALGQLMDYALGWFRRHLRYRAVGKAVVKIFVAFRHQFRVSQKRRLDGSTRERL